MVQPASGFGWVGRRRTTGSGADKLLTKLPVLQGQLIDHPDQGIAVGPQFGKLLLVSRAEFFELHDLLGKRTSTSLGWPRSLASP